MNRIILAAAALLLTGTISRAESGTPLDLPREYLSEILRHVYRWHLDETALLKIDDAAEIQILARPISMALDENDQSRYCELIIPQLSFVLLLKKADYLVPELDIRIENSDYRIQRAEKYEELPAPLENYQSFNLPKRETIAYLFTSRNRAEFPDTEMLERMRKTLRAQTAEAGQTAPTAPQTFYVAPISPVANDLWVFWESGGKIIRFSSDSDLTSKAYWEYEKLGVNVYDLREQVVVSLAEAAGSNAFVTRDWAARVLFNCAVFGQRFIITPEADLSKPMQVEEAPVSGKM